MVSPYAPDESRAATSVRRPVDEIKCFVRARSVDSAPKWIFEYLDFFFFFLSGSCGKRRLYFPLSLSLSFAPLKIRAKVSISRSDSRPSDKTLSATS